MNLPERNKETTTVGNYLKLKDGESAVGVFKGDVHSFRIKWEEGRSVAINEPDPGRHNRWKLNFLMKEGSSFVAKIFECGVMVYDQLAEINTEYDLTQTKVKISRRGSGKETSYSILPLLKEPIPPAIMQQLESVKLNILDGQARAPAVDEANPPWPDPELPF